MSTNGDLTGSGNLAPIKSESYVEYAEKPGQPVSPAAFPPIEWLDRLKAEYTGQHGGETLPAGCNPDRMARAVLTFEVEKSVEILKDLLATQKDDYTIDQRMLARLRELVQGHEACDMTMGDWSYEVSKRAGLCHNWSPYVEVRAVTLPYDDVEETCESLRAYLLGYFWVCVCTGINTFFAPRQPGISIPGSVVQLLLVPMGQGMAYILPDWGFTFLGQRYTLNPGPWTSKEQLFATIIFQGASSIGNFTGLLVLRMPVFFNQRWATFGFNIMLALANQVYGLGMAGILRRLSVYPIEAVWPNILPTLALNRTLVNPDNSREKVHGWTISRYRLFVYCSVVFLIYYWIPNTFFVGIRLFNWMTWISPNNFNLAAVTGSYGGMGFNPISSLDPNASGMEAMSSPFFAQLQQYCMRVISGLIIIIMYYKNAFWGAYMPINSNGVFDKTGASYNITKVLTEDQRIDVENYKTYGPPYYAIANLFVTGGNFIYYTFSIVYVFVKYWKPIKKAFVGMVINTWKRRSVYTGFNDGQARMMRNYKEVPEWWYGIVFLFGFVVSVISLVAWPTDTPWWSILGVTGVGFVLTIPWVIIQSIAHTGIPLGVIWQVLPGIWFPGQPLPQLIILMLGGAFEQMAGGFSADLKYAHYAGLPPRAVFRGHVSAVILNCFIYCGILEALMLYANNDSTLCSWDNKQYMVCAYAHSVWSSTIQFGAFGTNNMFQVYPVLPWCFLMGALLGGAWILAEKYLPHLRIALKNRMTQGPFESFDKYFWSPTASVMACFHPAIALSGGLEWAGNNNLTYATLKIYLAWVFQFYLKRRYTAWWSKYAYLVFAGLSVGVAVSALISTLVFSFGVGQGHEFAWWGNTVPREGVDYQLYNNNASLMSIPEEGFFGLRPEEYPMGW
ncbi:oligopeptide transporter 2 [Microdochium bolleyi]|uniref:Oligopeptide transporter 2 n=1 Tax=Microdochium bolleyi TaxID=196109 RepID=A0A136J913_9PEZI|nr:oligopeptide transporter 2 [Microdochium bolleyi]